MTTLRCNPRWGVEQEQWDSLLSILQNVQLHSILDKQGWITDIEDTFYVFSTCGYIDGNILLTGGGVFTCRGKSQFNLLFRGLLLLL